MSDRVIKSAPEGLEGWSEVWSEDLRFPEPSGWKHRFLRSLLWPFVGRLFRASEERQRNFNLALLEMVRGLRGDIAALGTEISRVHEEIARETSRRIEIGVGRNDALVAALDQKIEGVAARVRDLTTPLLSSPSAGGVREDFVYRRLEDGLRGSESEVRKALEPYLQYAREQQPVLDVGCGRGEFLVLCGEHNIEARGFDMNERSVADLRGRGFDVELDWVPHCFSRVKSRSLGSIMAAHVVEHLPVDALISLFAEAARVLHPGGYLMIETPNAQSLMMGGSDFWRDPTHVGPRHVGALTLMAREFDFAVAELRTVEPYPAANLLPVEEAQSSELREIVERLNAILFGDQNLRLILRKAG